MKEEEYIILDKVVSKAVGYLMKEATNNEGIYLNKIDITDDSHLCLIYLSAMSAALADKPFAMKLGLFDYIKFKNRFKKRINFKRKINSIKIDCDVVLQEIIDSIKPIEVFSEKDIFSIIYKEYYEPKDN